MKHFNILVCLRIFIAISGCFSVLFGAWSAHAGSFLTIEQQNSLSTALRYQFIHTLALLAVTVWYSINPHRFLLCAGLLFTLGVLAFSGSIYLKTLLGLSGASQFAPIGGIAMALGWLCLILVGEKKS